MPLVLRALVVVFAVLALTGPAAAAPLDLVIANGRVIDPESGLDGVRFVGIRGDKIVAISRQPLKGAHTIDATGLVVAPGFIDLHAHTETPYSSGLKALDGVTTALELEMGVRPVADWYAAMQGRAVINYGAAVSHLAAHAEAASAPGALGSDVYSAAKQLMTSPVVRQAAAKRLTAPELGRLDAALQAGIDAGALGIGMGIQYAPGADRAEILRGFEVAARNGVLVFAHARSSSVSEPDSIAALQELLADAVVSGAGVHMMHVNSSGLAQTPQLLAMIDRARKAGVNISTEAYPYGAGWSNIGSVMLAPGWRERLGIDDRDIQNMRTGARFDQESFERTRKEAPDTPVVAHIVSDAIVEAAVVYPGVIIASDSVEVGPGMGHPRTAGTYSKVLGRYVRERGLMSLSDAIAKMTLLPAQRMEASTPAMAAKGRLRVGADADVTVFDPARIVDRSTYEDPQQPSTGVAHVLVGGVAVVRDGELVDDARPGRAVRRPIKPLPR